MVIFHGKMLVHQRVSNGIQELLDTEAEWKGQAKGQPNDQR